MANNKSPSQLRTKMARINRTAYSVLLDRALVNQTTMADEVDALLKLEKDQLEVTKPLASFEVTKPEITLEMAEELLSKCPCHPVKAADGGITTKYTCETPEMRDRLAKLLAEPSIIEVQRTVVTEQHVKPAKVTEE